MKLMTPSEVIQCGGPIQNNRKRGADILGKQVDNKLSRIVTFLGSPESNLTVQASPSFCLVDGVICLISAKLSIPPE